MQAVTAFFEAYEEGANTFDPDLVVSHFTSAFLAADPNGVACLANDHAFRKAIPERRAFMAGIGFRSAKILGIEPTPLDPRYMLAKVHWLMVFEPKKGTPKEFRFFITYLLFDDGHGLKVAAYVSHEDEAKTMREGGLIP